MRKIFWAVAVIAVLAFVAGSASAGVIASFDNSGTWYTTSYESYYSTASLVASGTPAGPGSLGILSASGAPGSYYGLITNEANSQMPNMAWGSAGFGYWGSGAGAGAYATPYAESAAIYIDTALQSPMALAASDGNYWALSFSLVPSDPTGNIAGWPSPFTGSFELYPWFAGTTYVGVNQGAGMSNLASLFYTPITQSGWYTFQESYYEGGNGDVFDDFNVYNASGELIGESDGFDTGNPISDLGAPAYALMNTTQWLPDYAVPGLGLDNIQTETYDATPVLGNTYSAFDLTPAVVSTPEPISMVFFGTGLVAVAGFTARRRMLRTA